MYFFNKASWQGLDAKDLTHLYFAINAKPQFPKRKKRHPMFVQNINFYETIASTCQNTQESHARQFLLDAETENLRTYALVGKVKLFFLVSFKSLCGS